jgi:hypothetical protein
MSSSPEESSLRNTRGRRGPPPCRLREGGKLEILNSTGKTDFAEMSAEDGETDDDFEDDFEDNDSDDDDE